MKASRRLVDDGDFCGERCVSSCAHARQGARPASRVALGGHAPGVKTVREFNVSLKIDGATARSSRILPAMNADIDGALAQSAPASRPWTPRPSKSRSIFNGDVFSPQKREGPQISFGRAPKGRQKGPKRAPNGPQKARKSRGTSVDSGPSGPLGSTRFSYNNTNKKGPLFAKKP